MSQINVRNLSNENEDGAPDIVGISTFSATSYFVPPVGTTQQRPENPQGGDLRFNTDTASLEYFRGDTLNWSQIEMTSPDLNGGARALWGGGHPAINTVEYSTITTLGNAVDFGDITSGRVNLHSVSSRTRGVFVAGGTPTVVNTMDYMTISSTGDGLDFGDVTSGRSQSIGTSSQTRGLVGAGGLDPSYTNAISYITIAQTGNSVDYGDLTSTGSNGVLGLSACSSSTRSIFAGGALGPNGSTAPNVIEYSTISTTGNTSDFGDLTTSNNNGRALSNSTRGIFVWGSDPSASPSSYINNIEYITIATTGNSADFGDSTTNHYSSFGATSSPTRGVFAGGSLQNNISYVTILTTGNSVDFGDLITGRSNYTACSNAHGGL